MNRVIVTRGGRIESEHRVHVAVTDAGGRLVASAGDPAREVFLRSAAKPFQALPMVEDGLADRLGLIVEELAITCASHGGEPRHVEVVATFLDRLGIPRDALGCGAHLPMHEPSAHALLARGEEPRRIHNNCSGKHAGMLALARENGWPVAGYVEADHPLQLRMAEEVARWTGIAPKEMPRAVDGCGVVTFQVPLSALAGAFARFGRAAGAREPAARIVEAMVAEPFLIAGTGRLCTDLMDRAGDRLFAKTGAEGVYAAAALDGSFGIAVKVEDGGKRANDVALVHALAAIGVLDSGDLDALEPHARPAVLNTLGARVGEIRAELRLAGVASGAIR